MQVSVFDVIAAASPAATPMAEPANAFEPARIEPAPEAQADAPEGLELGQPLQLTGSSDCAWITGFQRETRGDIYSITTGRGMVRQNWRIEAACANYVLTPLCEDVATGMAKRAASYGHKPIPLDLLPGLVERARIADEKRRAADRLTEEKRVEATTKAREELAALAPAGVEFAIVASLDVNESDLMTDYFSHRTDRTVVLDWSKSKRNNFAEMRKAAGLFSETKHLVTGGEEHRQNYSGGGGLFLKDGGTHCSGWRIEKRALSWIACAGLEFTDKARGAKVEEPQPRAKASRKADGEAGPVAFAISEHVHTKKGFAIWVASPSGRMDRAEFLDTLAKAKELGGWYSRAWQGTPAGFTFKTADNAAAFVAAVA